MTSEHLRLGVILWFALSGLLNFALVGLLNTVSINLIGVSKAASVFGTAPLFATILRVAVLGREEHPVVNLGYVVRSGRHISYH